MRSLTHTYVTVSYTHLESGKIIRDIDNHDYSAEKELEDYFNIKEEQNNEETPLPVSYTHLPYRITIDNEKVIETETVIISTGATAKYLGLDNEKKYAGMGVSA